MTCDTNDLTLLQITCFWKRTTCPTNFIIKDIAKPKKGHVYAITKKQMNIASETTILINITP